MDLLVWILTSILKERWHCLTSQYYGRMPTNWCLLSMPCTSLILGDNSIVPSWKHNFSYLKFRVCLASSFTVPSGVMISRPCRTSYQSSPSSAIPCFHHDSLCAYRRPFCDVTAVWRLWSSTCLATMSNNNYYDYIVNWCSSITCNWCVSLDITFRWQSEMW